MVVERRDDNPLEVNIGLPWKKILLYGSLIIVFVVVVKRINKYLINQGISFSFANDFVSIMQKPIFYYPLLLVIISLIVVIIILKNGNVEKNRLEDRDVKKVLKIMDKLLKRLPKKEIDKFTRTDDAKLYSVVMKNYGVK